MIGLPFYWLAQPVMDMFDDDEEDIDLLIRKHTPKTLGRAITRGLPAALLGNDMSWRVQGTDVAGMPIGFQIGQMLWKRGQQAYKLHGQGEDLAAFFHVMPDMVRNPYRSVIGFKEGGTRKGVPAIKYTAWEATQKFLGYTLTREAEEYKIGGVSKKKQAIRNKKMGQFAEQYLMALKDNDSKKFLELKKDLQAWNKKERKKERGGVVIPWKAVLRSAKQRKRSRDKGYTEDIPKYMEGYQREVREAYK
jgi:hypothetical protein